MADAIFVAFWLALLCAAPALKVSSELTGHPDFGDPTAAENREPAPFPDFRHLKPGEIGGATERWYDDNFAFRAAIVDLYNDINLHMLESPVAQQVPGRGNWVFRRALLDSDPAQQGTWPEMEDCLGAFEATPQFLDDWRTLFEGRVAWAEAHGSRYLEVLTPVKAQIHPERLPFQASLHHYSVGEKVEAALAGSPVSTNVLFLRREMRPVAKAGKTLFYREDHHVNPLGAYFVFIGMDRAICALLGAASTPPPLLAEPPKDAGNPFGAPACWPSPHEDRLHVRVPGSRAIEYPPLGISAPGGRHYPGKPVYVTQPGGTLSMLLAHDSFLRFPLDSWHRQPPEWFGVPFSPVFGRIAMLLFVRFTTPQLERYIADEIPDVIVEQFSESKLVFGPAEGSLDDTMRFAAAFGRAEPATDTASNATYRALAVFEGVEAEGGGATATARLVDAADGAILDSRPVPPGIRRAAFFAPVTGAFPAGFTVRLDGAKCSSSRLEIRR